MTLQGIFTPNIVPLHPDRSINEDELRRYTSWLIDQGVSGLYPNGSTGEFIRLTFEQRLRVVEIMADETRGRVPILAGAAEANPDLILQACQRYADLGCAAASVTGPYYFKVSQATIEHSFRELAARSPIDILLYNIPQFSNEISLDVVKRLATDCPRIVGIKDSSRDLPRFLATLQEVKALRPGFSCLIGCEEILLPSLFMGGDGATVATSGVAPEPVMALYHAFQSGDLEKAKLLQFQLLPIIQTMFAAGNFPEGFRAAVSLRGFQTGPGLLSLSPAELEHLETTRHLLAHNLESLGIPAYTQRK
jgi:4-hydroxy-tetrahydrodipicolinate synthase